MGNVPRKRKNRALCKPWQLTRADFRNSENVEWQISQSKKRNPREFLFFSYALTQNKQKANLIYPIELFDRKIRLRNIARRKRQ